MKSLKPYQKQVPKKEHWGKFTKEYDTKTYREWSLYLRTANNKCAVLGKEFLPSNLVLDHIIPVSQGGSFWDVRNHQVIHANVHRSKTLKEQRSGCKTPHIINANSEKIPRDWENMVTGYNFKQI